MFSHNAQEKESAQSTDAYNINAAPRSSRFSLDAVRRFVSPDSVMDNTMDISGIQQDIEQGLHTQQPVGSITGQSEQKAALAKASAQLQSVENDVVHEQAIPAYTLSTPKDSPVPEIEAAIENTIGSEDIDKFLNTQPACSENASNSQMPKATLPDYPASPVIKSSARNSSSQPALTQKSGKYTNYRKTAAITEEAVQEEDTYPQTLWQQFLVFVDDHRKEISLAVAALCTLAMLIAVITVRISDRPEKDPYNERIADNVTVAGINIGGMTKEQAITAINRNLNALYQEKNMVVSLPDETITFSPADTGASLDTEALVQAAYSIGRTAATQSGSRSIDVLSYLNLNSQYIWNTLSEYAGRHSDLFVQSGYKLTGNSPELSVDKQSQTAKAQTLVITIGHPGYGLDINSLYQDIVDTYANKRFSVAVKSLEEEITPDPIDLEAIYKELYIAPVEPAIDKASSTVNSGKYGYDFDMDTVRLQLSKAKYGDVLKVSMRFIAPTGTADTLYFQDTLGTAQTSHSDNANRTHNLELACQALNGKVLQPGDTLSYNDTLGQRTTARGYLEAPAYSGTELVDTVGGGICQVSSTLYLCALYSDLEIVARSNHGFPVSYIPLGMDATVSWGSPDLKIKNTSDFPIKLQAEVADGMVSIKILGTETRDYYVKMEYEVSSVNAYNTVYQDYEDDGQYTDGQVIQEGENGQTVKTYKCKYSTSTDSLISRQYEATSVYLSTEEIIARVSPVETGNISELETEPVTIPPSDPETTPVTDSEADSEEDFESEDIDDIDDSADDDSADDDSAE